MKFTRKNLEGGQVVLTVTTLFLMISLTMVLGMSGPVFRSQRAVADLLESRSTYFLAEAGVEDVAYRLSHGKPYSTNGQILTIDGYTVTTNTATINGKKIVTAISDWNNNIRKVEATYNTGIGEVFFYGLQTGQGGFVMGRNAVVNGNIYSNGTVSGASNSYVTGSVFAVGNISGTTIGTATTGDAWAPSVSGAIVRGNLYCQTGVGNNKACNTSKQNPSPEPFPITDSEITQWKTEAEVGGVTIGNYSANNTSLGPRKITGNLTISGTVTINGTVWVVGNISISNGSTVRLASSFGTNSGVIVTDGMVDMNNNVNFQGSGQTGSYIMLLTTSDCPTGGSCGGEYAMDISNNVQAVILNAQKGTIHFNNNSGAKNATANGIYMDNNSTIYYDAGIVNQNFTSGPGGAWRLQSWKETK